MKRKQLSSLLDQRIDILTLRKDTETGIWSWEKDHSRWAAVEVSGTVRAIFSRLGIGARGVSITLRPDPALTLHSAIAWEGRHIFLTSIIKSAERDRQQVEGALVEPILCTDRNSDITFPGVLTEEYHRHQQLDPQAVNTQRQVLVTPKEIELKPGKLVEINGVHWPILTAEVLDPYKNEYIIERRVDL